MAIDYWEEGEVLPEVNTMERLRELADDATLLESEIDDLTVKLAEKQEALAKINTDIIPGIMMELQLKSFKLADGSEIVVEDKIRASIPVAKKPEAYKWLHDHGYDGIIKTNVSATFGKGDIEEARKAVEALEAAGVSSSVEQTIHPGTLVSFVKERLAAAAEVIPMETDGFDSPDKAKEPNLPLDIFSVYEFKQAKIKAPRKTKKKK